MKNKLSLNRPLLKTALVSAFVLTCLAPFPQAIAQALGPVVFTEVNDTTLTATLGVNGPNYGTVQPLLPDDWLWTPPAGARITSPPGALGNWIEPEDPAEVNLVSAIAGANALSIESDILPNPNAPAVQDGIYLPNLTIASPSGTTVGMIYFDKAAGSEVPYRSSSLGLLSIPGLALVGGVRLGRLQPC